MSVKKKILLSPLAIIILIIIFGVGIAGAAIYFGGGGSSNEDVSLGKGLVGWWKFDGNAKDSTPNANHGTVTGTTLTTDRKETANKAYSFNGTTDHITVPDSQAIKPTGAVTIEFWVKPD